MAYSAEEEQELHELKEWWKENYKGLLVVFFGTLAAVYGWRFWQQHQLEQSQLRSMHYEQVLNQEDENALKTFVAEDDSTYSTFALFAAAKKAVSDHQYKEAKVFLEQAQQKAKESLLKDLASLRLAEVQLQLKDFDNALETLKAVKGETWLSKKSLIAGNIYLAKGEKDKARQVFEEALEKASEEEKMVIELRLNNL